MMATGPLGWWRATAMSVPMRNHYTKKHIRFIPDEVNSKIYPYLNPINPMQKA
jgi:hypothetical protein